MNKIKQIVGNINIAEWSLGLLFIAIWYATFFFTFSTHETPKRYIFYGLLIPFILSYARKHKKHQTKGIKLTSFIFSIIISVTLTLGFSIARTNSFTLSLDSFSLFFIWIIKLGIYAIVFYQIAVSLISNIEELSQKAYSHQTLPISNKIIFFIFFISRLPYLFIYYPCFWGFDEVVMLGSFSPSRLFSNHHPFCIAVLQKLFFEIGSYIGDPSIGFALFSIILFSFASAILVYTVRVTGRMGLKIKYQWIVIIVYSLFPVYAMINMYISKDGIFTYSILLYTTSLLDIQNKLACNQTIGYKILFTNGTAALIMCLSRNQGIYIILLLFVFLLILYRKRWFYWVKAYLPVIFIYYSIVSYFYPSINVNPSSKGEILGNLFQQSALSLIKNPNKISKEEKESFERLIQINTDSLESIYLYYLTDPVKKHYKYNPVIKWQTLNNFSESDEKNAIKSYLTQYKKTLKNNFATCCLAEINLINRFFYNDYKWDKDDRMFLWRCYDWHKCPYLLPELSFKSNMNYYHITNKCFKILSRTPLLEFIFSLSYYTWIFIFSICILFLRKDKQGMVSFAPGYFSLFILFMCPIAQYRYLFPLIIITPLLILYLIHPYGVSKQDNSRSHSVLQ